jgi:hypothetical protein
MTLNNWLVSNIYGDPNDFISTIMQRQFNATYIEGEDDDAAADLLIDLYSALAQVLDEMSALWHIDYLLDPDVFRRVFQLGNFGIEFAQSGSFGFDLARLSGEIGQLESTEFDRNFEVGIISDTGSHDDRQKRLYLSAYQEDALTKGMSELDYSAPMLLGLGIVGLQATGRKSRRPQLSSRFFD